MRTVVLTILALVAFAANSVLCRLALSRSSIDPATFTTIRLSAGAAALLVVSFVSRGTPHRVTGSWASAILLLMYAVPFSFAYTRLTTGTGALILFGAVQLTMLVAAISLGERPHFVQWVGLCLAAGGLVYLVMPGLAAPSLQAAGLMGLAGFSWGVYSLRGRQSTDPLAQTLGNFVRSVPFVLVVSLFALPWAHVGVQGVVIAVISGAVASGLGYVIWYAALGGLTAVRAAVVQLSVPILAAAAGVIFLAEALTMRLILAAVMVLGGIAAAIVGREKVVGK